MRLERAGSVHPNARNGDPGWWPATIASGVETKSLTHRLVPSSSFSKSGAGPGARGYHTTWIAITTRKAATTSEAIHVTVRLASASTRGLGSRLGLNLWRRFCGRFACDGLFPAAMAAVSFEMVGFSILIYAVSRAREVFLVGTHWRGFPINRNTNSEHEKICQVPSSKDYARSTSLLGLSSQSPDEQKARAAVKSDT